jgi:hypothetical protein
MSGYLLAFLVGVLATCLVLAVGSRLTARNTRTK